MKTQTTKWYQNRRQFVSRVSGTTAIMVASGLGFKFTPAKKGERIASLSSTDALRRFGISKYRIRLVDVAGGRRRVEADLLGTGGDAVGHFKGVDTTVRGKSADPVAERELTLPNESLAVRINKETRTFHVSHNRRPVGEAGLAPASITPQLQAFTVERPDLLRFISEVNHDIGKSLRDVAPASFVITQNVVEAETCVCLKQHQSCSDYCWDISYDELKSNACDESKATVQACCKSKPFGQSCCQTSSACNCDCVSGDFFCWCHFWGNALQCSKITCS